MRARWAWSAVMLLLVGATCSYSFRADDADDQKIQASISRLLDTMTLSELASDGFVPVAELASTT